jgi:hypothetical protein
LTDLHSEYAVSPTSTLKKDANMTTKTTGQYDAFSWPVAVWQTATTSTMVLSTLKQPCRA